MKEISHTKENRKVNLKVPKLYYKNNLDSDLYLFYFLWPIIIFPKEIQFIVIFLILMNLLSRHKIHFDKLSYFIFLFLIIYLFSIFYNIIYYSHELTRIIATINTFSIWVFAFIFHQVLKLNSIAISKIKRITFINYCILIFLWICSVLIYYITNSPSLSIGDRYLYYTEWFGYMTVIRFVGFMEYSNLIIMFFMFFYPIYLSNIIEFKNIIVRIFLITIGLLPIVTTFSRSGYLIILIYLLIISIVYLYRGVNKKMFVSVAFITLSIIIPIIVYTKFSEDLLFILHELFNAREGSNNSRIYLLEESIQVTIKNSPLIGMGLKASSSIGYPLGSHSTLIGFFYKTGIIGLITGSIIFLVINLKMLFNVKNPDKTLMKVSLIMMSFLFIIEDIDGSNWLIIFYFILIALVLNNEKAVIYNQDI